MENPFTGVLYGGLPEVSGLLSLGVELACSSEPVLFRLRLLMLLMPRLVLEKPVPWVMNSIQTLHSCQLRNAIPECNIQKCITFSWAR